MSDFKDKCGEVLTGGEVLELQLVHQEVQSQQVQVQRLEERQDVLRVCFQSSRFFGDSLNFYGSCKNFVWLEIL